LCQPIKECDLAMVVKRFRTCLATSVGPFAPANSRRSRRFTGAFPSLISISNCASRVAPRASRLTVLSALDAASPPTQSAPICITDAASRRSQQWTAVKRRLARRGLTERRHPIVTEAPSLQPVSIGNDASLAHSPMEAS
jgi:hypothetical protein